jgi:hypothetical protein
MHRLCFDEDRLSAPINPSISIPSHNVTSCGLDNEDWFDPDSYNDGDIESYHHQDHSLIDVDVADHGDFTYTFNDHTSPPAASGDDQGFTYASNNFLSPTAAPEDAQEIDDVEASEDEVEEDDDGYEHVEEVNGSEDESNEENEIYDMPDPWPTMQTDKITTVTAYDALNTDFERKCIENG